MKRLASTLAALAIAIAAPAQSWPTPAPEAKAGVRWWWFGSAVDTANIRWNMEQYASHGIGAVEITPIYGVQGNEKNEISYLSDRWMQMLRFVEDQGRRLGIEVDMATGTGWPFGGPWVPLEESCSRMVIVDKTAEGKKVKAFDISAPEKNRQRSRLAAVFAWDANHDFADLTAMATTTGNGTATLNARLPQKGTWRIIALWQELGAMKVKRPAPGGDGWVVDHFDKSAVEHYLDHIAKAFSRTGTPFPHTFFNDSYEVSAADYTPSLFGEFQARRGYSLKENFDKLVDGDQKTVADYRETLGDLLLHNFTRTWTQWAHSHGAITRNQAHGSPANLIDCYAAVDIPEIEGFGLTDFGIKGLRTDPGKTRKNDSDFSMLKWAPSAAHIAGKRWASSETFTWLTEHFRTSLSQMKPDLDLMFCAGVNHMFFHGTPYSPRQAEWPGWQFYASVNMSPTNSTWRDAPFLMKYIQRAQSFLQWGQPDNDFLVFLPVRDMWNSRSKGKRLMQLSIHNMKALAPDFIESVLDIDRAGFDCDYISEQLLLGTRCVDGKLVTAAGTTYKALVIPSATNILTSAVRAHIERLKAQGARIVVGSKSTAAMAQAARPEEMKSELGLKMIRRKNDKGWHYFIANLTPDDVNAYATLAVPFQKAVWFNPMNGERYAVETQDGKVRIDLRSGESLILQTFTNADAALNAELATLSTRKDAPYEKTGKILSTGWYLSFKESTPEIDDVYPINRLQSWETMNDSTRNLMGTGVYEITLNMKPRDLQGCNDWAIDLGDVRESARVYVNDELVGCAWAAPFVLQFSDKFHVGKNTLRIEVTNLPANRIAQMDRDGVEWRKMDDINVVDINYKKTTYAGWEPMPSGLNSRVFLYRVKGD